LLQALRWPGIFTGLSLNPAKISSIIGVAKAYTTRVGGGPFPTETLGDVGTKLQEIGREFGTTTKRRRRCGWLDLVVLRYSTTINHYTALNLTKLDVLDTFETIKIATAYLHPDTGEELPSFPADLDLLSRVKIVYHEMPGWREPIREARAFSDLPKPARDYVVGVPPAGHARLTRLGVHRTVRGGKDQVHWSGASTRGHVHAIGDAVRATKSSCCCICYPDHVPHDPRLSW
jgi:adenylosuccinate synthase